MAHKTRITFGGLYVAYRFYKASELLKADEGFAEAQISDDLIKLKILVLGLDNSGKSQILAGLKKSKAIDALPSTTGCSVIFYKYIRDNYTVGGGLISRRFWSNYIEDTNLLMYVVDSADSSRFSESNTELHKILCDLRLNNVPILIVANKQDLGAAEPANDVLHALAMDNLSRRDRHAGGDVYIVGTSVKRLYDGRIDSNGTGELEQIICKILT